MKKGHAGLVQKKVTVKTKRGTAQRSMWVKASGAVKGAARAAGGFVSRHKNKIAGAAVVAATAYALHKGGRGIAAAARGAHAGQDAVKHLGGGLKDRVRGALDGAAAGMSHGHGDSHTGTRAINAVKGVARKAGHEIASTARMGAGLARTAGMVARHPIEGVKALRNMKRNADARFGRK